MKIIGFDIGLRNLGWGIIVVDEGKVGCVDHGVIHTEAKQPYGASLCHIREEVQAVIEYWRADYVAIEDMHPVAARRIASIKGTNYVIGVLHELVVGMGIPEPILIAPSTMKKRVAGDGRASKVDVAMAVVAQLKIVSLKTKDNHAMDALGVALAAFEEIENGQT